jgi:putative endonuclease
MYFVYILESKKDESLYIGYTSDLKRRLQEHQAGLSRYTRRKLPIKLIYYECYLNRNDAKGREIFLKSGAGWRFLKKQLKHYLKDKNIGSRAE